MVSGLQDTDVAEGAGVDEAVDLSVNAEPDVDVDPVTALRDELAATKAEFAEFKGRMNRLDPDRVNAAMGRVQSLQQELARRPADPIAAIDPRLAESEEVLSDLVDALIGSDMLDDASKGALRQRRQKLDSGRSERENAKLRRDLLKEVQGARETIQEQAPPPSPTAAVEVAAWAATSELRGYAAGKGIDFDGLPPTVLSFNAAEQQAAANADFSAAMTRVKAEIDRLAGESAAPERVAARRRAAGNGAPAAAGTGAFRSQVEIDTAHMEGRLTSAQVSELRRNGRYAALPYTT